MTATPRVLRQALRSLLRVPAFSITVVASIGVSVAAITTVFSIAHAVLLGALPFRDPERLVWLGSIRANRTDGPFSLPEFLDYSARARSIEVAAFTQWNAAMATPTVARRLQGMSISANAPRLLGAAPSLGRLLRADDGRAGAPRVVMLSRRFWLDEFGGDPSVIGRAVRLNDQPHEIVGVLPAHFPLPLPGVQVVVPLVPELDPRRTLRSSTNFLFLFGRLSDGAVLETARQDLNATSQWLRATFPADYATKLGVAVTPMKEFLVGKTRRTFVVMLGASALLLCIALANVLNLILIRGLKKRGEIALRRALGGSGGQLAVGAMAEALLLASAGALTGALIARWLVSLAAASSVNVLRLDEARLSPTVLGFVAGVALLATLLIAVVQLAGAMRATPRQALASLARGVHGSSGEARVRDGLLVAQLGFAVLLTIVTVGMGRSFARLQSVSLGFEPDSVLVTRLTLPPQKYSTVATIARFSRELEAGLTGIPGVSAAGGISIAPLSAGLAIIPFSIPGRVPEHDRERLEAHLRAVTPGYFTAVGAHMRTGRGISATDDENAARVAVISRALSMRYFGDAEPIGRGLLVNDNNVGPRPITIVGVVDDMRHVRLDAEPEMDIYIPMAQYHPDGVGFLSGRQYWVARVGAGAADFPRAIANGLGQLDRDVAMAGVEPLRGYVEASLAPRRFSVLALLSFASAALLLAVIGVYGIVAYSVAQRRREIGLRLALGATGGAVARTFVQPVVMLALTGVTLGVVGALATERIVAGLLFGVTPNEPIAVTSVGAMLVVASVLAAAVPVRRALRVDPAITLRDE